MFFGTAWVIVIPYITHVYGVLKKSHSFALVVHPWTTYLYSCRWYKLEYKSVRANPEFGSLPISEVLRSLNFRIRKFSYSFPFRHAYANNGAILFRLSTIVNSTTFYKRTRLTDFPDIQYSTRCSIRLPKGERVRKLRNSEVQRPKTSDIGILPNSGFARTEM